MWTFKPIPTFSVRRVAAFWARVTRKEPHECWPWTGTAIRGYGKFGDFQAHRIAYTLERGPIPDGLTIDHLCRNPGCVNPAHLEPVTVRENTLRGYGPSAQAARATTCPRGHVKEPSNRKASGDGCRACRAIYQLEYRRRRAAREASDPIATAERKRKNRERTRRQRAARRERGS